MKFDYYAGFAGPFTV